jgi:hypothetical protein
LDGPGTPDDDDISVPSTPPVAALVAEIDRILVDATAVAVARKTSNKPKSRSGSPASTAVPRVDRGKF